MDTTSLSDVRNTTLIVIALFGLLRDSELKDLHGQDVHSFSDRRELLIRKSKCDQLRSGNKVLIARLGGQFCPVHLLEQYLQLAGMHTPLFSAGC